MSEHVHTGLYAFAFAGVSAIVFANMLRLFAIWLAGRESTEWLAKAIGGLINYTAVGAPA